MTQKEIDNITEQFTMLYPKLFRYAMSRTGNKHYSDDLVMQTFTNVLENFRDNNNKFPTQLESYLIRSIRNKIIDDGRRFDRFSGFDDVEGYLEPVDPNLPSDPFMSRRIENAYKNLSDNCREILGLIALGWSYEQIQSLTERNRNSVAGLVFRCREKFRVLLFGNTDRRI